MSQGGHLSSIHSDREAFFVGTLTGQNAWIGLPYEVSNASLDLNRWSDGSAVGYTHWASGYAGGVMLGQCIGTLGPFNRFTWNISDCYDCKSYVCKKGKRSTESLGICVMVSFQIYVRVVPERTTVLSSPIATTKTAGSRAIAGRRTTEMDLHAVSVYACIRIIYEEFLLRRRRMQACLGRLQFRRALHQHGRFV